MSLSERLEAAEPFFRLAREVINPADGERPWHADSKDWMVVFSFAGQTLTLGDLRRAAAEDTAYPLPQQTALVEQGIEKIIAQHEPAACGASAPSEPPRSDGRCSTCRHFTPEESGFGSCARWRTGYGVSADELASDEVLVENDEGWGMLAGPNFGCVLHNPPAGGEG